MTDRLPRGQRVLAWFQFLGRGPGMLAFVIHRVTGFALVLYLLAHLSVLSMLAAAPQLWDRFVRVAKAPPFLALDVLLVGALVGHGLNGLRLAALGFGLGTAIHRQLVWVVLGMSLVVTGVFGYGLLALGG